jgi:hypothetical protein
LALGADQLGLLLILDVRRAAALCFAVDGDLIVGGHLPGAEDLPLDEDSLEGLGIELGEYALEGGFLGVIPSAAAFAVTAQRTQLERGELGRVGCQAALAALAAHHA